MVLDVLGELAAGSIRDLAKNLFSGFYDRGISANEALRELRSNGLGYRRSDFLKDYAQGQGTYNQETKVKYVSKNAIPTEGILSSEYHGVPDKYSFVFKATGQDLDTGETTTQYFYYHRQTLDTRANMEQAAQDWIETQAERYGFSVEDVSIREGYINPAWA